MKSVGYFTNGCKQVVKEVVKGTEKQRHVRHPQDAASLLIPDKRFQLVRYYGWYSNKMRGRRSKQAAAVVQPDGKAAAVIDVSEHKSRRIPSKKWRELIKKVWEADPLLCPRCQKEMRIVSLRRLQNPCKRRFQASGRCNIVWFILIPET
jgi:hypothetical protein